MGLALVAPEGRQAAVPRRGPHAEQRVALAPETGRAPAAFLRRLGQGQGYRDDIHPVQQRVHVAPLDPIALGHDGEPQPVGGVQALTQPQVMAQLPQPPALGEDLFVDLQDQGKNGLKKYGLARRGVADVGQIGGQAGKEKARHAAIAGKDRLQIVAHAPEGVGKLPHGGRDRHPGRRLQPRQLEFPGPDRHRGRGRHARNRTGCRCLSERGTDHIGRNKTDHQGPDQAQRPMFELHRHVQPPVPVNKKPPIPPITNAFQPLSTNLSCGIGGPKLRTYFNKILTKLPGVFPAAGARRDPGRPGRGPRWHGISLRNRNDIARGCAFRRARNRRSPGPP